MLLPPENVLADVVLLANTIVEPVPVNVRLVVVAVFHGVPAFSKVTVEFEISMALVLVLVLANPAVVSAYPLVVKPPVFTVIVRVVIANASPNNTGFVELIAIGISQVTPFDLMILLAPVDANVVQFAPDVTVIPVPSVRLP